MSTRSAVRVPGHGLIAPGSLTPAEADRMRDRMVPSAYRWIYGMVLLMYHVAGERVEAALRWWAILQLLLHPVFNLLHVDTKLDVLDSLMS